MAPRFLHPPAGVAAAKSVRAVLFSAAMPIRCSLPGVRAPALVALLALASGCGPHPEPPSVLLVTLDTTRADAIGVYGGPPGLTPSIDGLAREGITFGEARTVAPLTLPAHASMLTGLYPLRHGLRTNGLRPLPDSARTLAEGALELGYRTAAFVAAPVLDRRFGLDQGFETWSQPKRMGRDQQAADHYGALTCEQVTDRALRWLEQRDRGAPFFVWVHYFDPHAPWNPPPAFRARAGDDAYLAEVARVDAGVGRLVEALDADGALDDTLVAVVGDHGESRGEHGERTHGHFVYEATLRIPFVIRPPRGRWEDRRGTAEMGPTSAVDVFATLAGAMGWAAGSAGDGDGLDLLSGPVPDGRGVYFECYYGYAHFGWSPIAGWADARAKYVHSPSPELYVPRTWPDERVNRIHERTEDELGRYRDRLAALAALPRLKPEAAAGGSDLAEGLSALGYVEVTSSGAGAMPDPLEPSELPSPHTRASELKRCDRVRTLILTAQEERAVEVLHEILAGNPRNAFALETLAEQLLKLGTPERAVPVYRELLELSEPRGSIHAGFGRALERTGELEAALEHYRLAVELVPEDTETMRLLAAGLDRLGRSDEAERWRSEAQRRLGH